MNYDQIAKMAFNVITNFINPKEDEVISIFTEIFDEKHKYPLSELKVTEEFALSLRKRKAFPLLEVTTENLQKRFFEETPEEIIKTLPKYFEKRIEDISIFLEVGWKALKNPYENIYAESKYLLKNIYKITEKIRNENKRIIFLNYPSEDLAKFVGDKFDKLLENYFSLLNCDYRNLDDVVGELKFFLQNNEVINIETKSGNLKFLTQPKDTKIFSQGANNILILPVGKAEVPVKRAFLNGIFLAENLYYKDRVCHNVEVSFKDGFIYSLKQENPTSKTSFELKNNLIGSQKEVLFSIGFNTKNLDYSNYYSYDRNIYNAVSLKFYDSHGNPIILINKNNKNNIEGL